MKNEFEKDDLSFIILPSTILLFWMTRYLPD